MDRKSQSLRPVKPKLPEVRCFRCNRLLFRGIAENVEIKCSRCGAIQYIDSGKQKSGLIIHTC